MSIPESPSLWRHRVFQQLFWAHALSLTGSGLTSLALGLLAHQLVGASASTVLGITLAIRIGVIVVCSPWAGQLSDRFGARRLMVMADIMRAGVVVCFFFADSVWQIYALAVLLNLGSAVFTPVYRAVIPGAVTPEQCPRALAVGSIAYDMANILGPSLAALIITLVGFRGVFVVDARGNDSIFRRDRHHCGTGTVPFYTWGNWTASKYALPDYGWFAEWVTAFSGKRRCGETEESVDVTPQTSVCTRIGRGPVGTG